MIYGIVMDRNVQIDKTSTVIWQFDALDKAITFYITALKIFPESRLQLVRGNKTNYFGISVQYIYDNTHINKLVCLL